MPRARSRYDQQLVRLTDATTMTDVSTTPKATVLSCRCATATKADRAEVVRRCTISLSDLAALTGWKPERYGTRGVAA